ncbi:hypothetical protein ACHQM5_002602 [Ranunculus cassubicifolius]
MATSAFKSTTKRSRSLSRAPSPRFVNTVRGTALPHDVVDLLPESFKDDDDKRRHGRSLSRRPPTTTSSSSASTTRRRSLSVATYRRQFSDSETEDPCHHKSSNNRMSISKKPIASNHQPLFKSSFTQNELSNSCDGYSSHSSALTDEEALDTRSCKNGTERTIRHSQKKTEHPTGDGVPTGLYEVMCKELRHAVEDIRTEIEQGIMKAHHPVLVDDDSLQSNNSDVLQAVSVIRKNYTTKLEQSEKRKQDLLAEIEAEEQRGRELSKIVKELLPEANNTGARKNNDKNWMSKCLVEDAEKYFDDFLSNIEDTTTDISSFDGERSDASSSKQQHNNNTSEMDGVVLPWLQWETSSYDAAPLKTKVPFVAQTQEMHIYNKSNLLGGSSGCRNFNMDDYSVEEEDIIFESWRQRLRITSGTLSLCTRPFLLF